MKFSISKLFLAFILSFFTITFSTELYATNMTFRKHQVQDGLSENSIYCIIQDHDGFMWFGTKDGLNKFDGYEYRIFRNEPSNPNSLGNNFIRSLYQDKSGIIWVGTDHKLYLLDSKTEVFESFDIKTKDGLTINSAVTSIVAENGQNIWIGTMTQGAFCYDIETKTLVNHQQSNSNTTLNSNLVWTIYNDASNTIWIGTRNGLSEYYKETNTFFTYGSRDKPEYFHDPEVLAICEDSDGEMWFGTWAGGLIRHNKSTNMFETYFDKNDKKYITHIRTIFEFEKNKLLIGADDGLYMFDKSNNQYERIDYPGDPNSLSDQNVYSIFRDQENGIWVGTYFGGVNYVSPNSQIIEHFYPNHRSNSLSGKAVSEFCEDIHGNLWIATEDGGLNYYNTSTKTFKNYLPQKNKNSISYHNLHSLVLNDEKLWIGTFSRGLDVLDLKTNKFKNYSFSNTDSLTIDDNCVFAIYKTRDNTIYVGTPYGLSRYNAKKDNFERIEEVRRFVYDILEDHQGNLWIATQGKGVYKYNSTGQTWKNYTNNENDSSSLSFNKVIDIYEDEKHRLWFGTDGGGLCKYSFDEDNFSTINYIDGLPSDVVYGILADKFGDIWVSTNKGISRISLETMDIKTLSQKDGLQSNQFNYRSSFKTSDGKFYFGGINGFNAFYPDQVKDNPYIPPVHITNFELLEIDTPTEKDFNFIPGINLQKKITLTHNQASFRISFVSLSFLSQEKNKYSYILENLNSNWIQATNERQASYIDLAPGEYTFRVKGSNNNEIWNDTEDFLFIEILPPWWKTKIALAAYIIIIVLIFIYAIRYYLNIIKLRQRVEIEELQSKREKEIYDSKINFFTNIAHEIRTPVSLIKAPLDDIMTTFKGDDATQENLNVINKNTERLLSLINQLLDFRKIEKESFSLTIKDENLNQIINEVCFRFMPAAQKQSIAIESSLPKDPVFINADNDGITKVFSNLMTNALKFTKSTISIILGKNTSENIAIIKVIDDGPGIDPKYLDKIFEPFFQIEKDVVDDKKYGSGIGLALSKQIIERHGGKIYIDSKYKSGSAFIIELPIMLSPETTEKNQVKPGKITEKEHVGLSKDLNKKSHQKQIILVVEDNEDLLNYLKNGLKKEYEVLTATNGKKALSVLDKNIIDLIISDIIMPEMGGLELVKSIRTDQQYSHIPIIILSARTNTDTKIDGLDFGAESYIEKPFSMEYVKAQINSLLTNRARLIEKFSSSPFIPFGSITTNKKDEEFLNTINIEIEESLSNPDYNVEKLSRAMAMSRSKLQRKIKGLTEMSPNDYIRVYRLKKAALLIAEGSTRINEVCYLTGFNSPSYFSRCFQKQFGKLPSELLKEHKVDGK